MQSITHWCDSRGWRWSSCAALAVALGMTWSFPARSAEAKDHPLVTPPPQASIVAYTQDAERDYRLVLGSLRPGGQGEEAFEKTQVLHGKVTRIQYAVSGQSAITVYSHFSKSLLRGEFDRRFIAKGPKLGPEGGTLWARTAYSGLYDAEPAPEGLYRSVNTDARHYLVAEMSRSRGGVFVAVFINPFRDDEVRIQVDVVEQVSSRGSDRQPGSPRGLAQGERFVIKDVELDGDGGLTARAAPGLSQIAAVMASNRSLKVHVVGHSARSGDFDKDRARSVALAEAIRSALIERYRIEPERLSAHGVGPLAPACPGQQGLRGERVELVPR